MSKISLKLFRPPDIYVGGLMFCHRFFLSFFFRQLLSALAERNSIKTGHMFVSKCVLKIHVQKSSKINDMNFGPQMTSRR